MESPLMVHGICRNHFIYGENNGIAVVTVNTTVCLLRRKRERNLVTGLSIIMGNDHSDVFLGSRNLCLAFSALNLAMHFHGWMSFFILVNYKLPLRPNKKTYYEYTSLWHIYEILLMNCWLWSAVFHSRDVDLTQKLDCSSNFLLFWL